MVQPENIDSGHSSFQLDDRSGRHHCNLARLLIHALSRPWRAATRADKDLRRAAKSLGRRNAGLANPENGARTWLQLRRIHGAGGSGVPSRELGQMVPEMSARSFPDSIQLACCRAGLSVSGGAG